MSIFVGSDRKTTFLQNENNKIFSLLSILSDKVLLWQAKMTLAQSLRRYNSSHASATRYRAAQALVRKYLSTPFLQQEVITPLELVINPQNFFNLILKPSIIRKMPIFQIRGFWFRLTKIDIRFEISRSKYTILNKEKKKVLILDFFFCFCYSNCKTFQITYFEFSGCPSAKSEKHPPIILKILVWY